MRKYQSLLFVIALNLVASCGTTTQHWESPSSDMLVPPAELQEATDVESFGDVIEYNNRVLLEDRDKLIRWQEWWKGREGH